MIVLIPSLGLAEGYNPNDIHRTSNQLIVLGQLKQTTHAQILPKACKLAKEQHDIFPGVQVPDLAVDNAVHIVA